MSSASQAATEFLDQVDWADVLDTLQAQKCVLFLGGGAYQLGAQELDAAIQASLGWPAANHPHIKHYNADGFVLLKKNRYRRHVATGLREFYSQAFPDTELAFAQLARIPFHAIISLTPDNLLARTFDNLGLDYQQDFYFRNRKAPDQYEEPTADRPLIYNLLGNIEEPESLVLTHQDFFDYLNSVFNSSSMHEDLKLTLKSAERFIFLGLPYEKWYFQLLLRVLSLQADELQEIERLALQEFDNENLQKIYAGEFKLDFVPVGIGAFLDRLFRECDRANLIKEVVEQENVDDQGLNEEQLRELVAEAKTEAAMEQLKLRLKARQPRSNKLYTDLTVLRNRYKLLMQREMRGTIDSRDFSVENAQIVEQLLELINQSATL